MVTANARAPTSRPTIAQKNMSSTRSFGGLSLRSRSCQVKRRYVTTKARRYIRPYHRMGRNGTIWGWIQDG